MDNFDSDVKKVEESVRDLIIKLIDNRSPRLQKSMLGVMENELKLNTLRDHYGDVGIEAVKIRLVSILQGRFERSFKLVVESYFEYREAFRSLRKSGEFDIFSQSRLEDIIDRISELKRNSKIKKYASKFLRSYVRLMDEKSLIIIGEIMDAEMPDVYVRNSLRKIAKCKSAEDLNILLEDMLMSKEDRKQCVYGAVRDSGEYVSVVYEDQDRLAVLVNEYEASKVLGAKLWCISTDEDYFWEYTTTQYSEYAKIYCQSSGKRGEVLNENFIVFVYDFSRMPADRGYQIGLTIGSNGELLHAQDKFDSPVKFIIDEYIDKETYRQIVEGSVIRYSDAERVLSDSGGEGTSPEKYLIYSADLLLSTFVDPIRALRRLVEGLREDDLVEEIIEDSYLERKCRVSGMPWGRGGKYSKMMVPKEIVLVTEYIDKAISDYHAFGRVTESQMKDDLEWFFYLSVAVSKLDDKYQNDMATNGAFCCGFSKFQTSVWSTSFTKNAEVLKIFSAKPLALV